jgi:hypothetical protein
MEFTVESREPTKYREEYKNSTLCIEVHKVDFFRTRRNFVQRGEAELDNLRQVRKKSICAPSCTQRFLQFRITMRQLNKITMHPTFLHSSFSDISKCFDQLSIDKICHTFLFLVKAHCLFNSSQ